MMSAPAITTNAIASLRVRTAWSPVACATRCTLCGPSEQAGGPDQQHDRHDDEDHGVGCLGKEDLGEALDDAQSEPGHDRAHDRTHAADHYHGEHHDDEIRAHLGAYVV